MKDGTCSRRPGARHSRRGRSIALASALAWAALALHAGYAYAGDTLRVGSKRFGESYLLGELLTRTAAAAGAAAEHHQGLGNTAILFAALRQGSIDLYPEYTGTVTAEILQQPDVAATPGAIDRALRPLGIGAAIPFGFDNTYAIAVGDRLATAQHLATISDLARLPALRPGLSHEFLGRADGWPGLARAYGLRQQPVALDHGLAYEALRAGQVDAIDVYATDARIAAYRLRVLRDDKGFFPRYDAVVLYRLDVPARFPRAWQALSALAGSIDTDRMIALNGEVELRHRSFAEVAAELVDGASGAKAGAPAARTAGLWSRLAGADFWPLTAQHVKLVATSVALAVAAGVPLGALAALNPATGSVVLGITAALQTVPSLALLAMLIPLVGSIGTVPALIALFLYALLPVVRNTCTGLQEVPAGIRLAALALGLSSRDRLRHIDLPLALPVILAGVKTAAVLSVGTATIAAFIGAGGYGERISIGLALNDSQMLWAGALPAAALAVMTQGLFGLLELLWRRRHPY